jgi:DNA-binding GntR family transcriptional regulator
VLLRDATYQAIRHAILTCEFQPGQELREQILAERYHVSRSPVRDALLRLEQENLVTVLPRQGYRVTPITIPDVQDFFALRLLIEPACAVAAARARDTALRALDRFRGFVEQDDTKPECVEYDRSFHHTLADLSGNQRIAEIARSLMGEFERLAQVARRTCSQEAVRRECVEHEAIIDALQAHDADRASRLCHEHVDGAHKRLAMRLRLAVCQWPVPEEQPTTTEAIPI